MTSRRRRPHYRPAAIGYRASRWKARLPRQAGLTGVHLRSVLRFASGFHPTRPHGKGLGCAMPASVSCSCLRLLVASNGPHEGLSPSVIHPCPTHLQSGQALLPFRPPPLLVVQSSSRSPSACLLALYSNGDKAGVSPIIGTEGYLLRDAFIPNQMTEAGWFDVVNFLMAHRLLLHRYRLRRHKGRPFTNQTAAAISSISASSFATSPQPSR